jgi:hypothetical protein
VRTSKLTYSHVTVSVFKCCFLKSDKTVQDQDVLTVSYSSSWLSSYHQLSSCGEGHCPISSCPCQNTWGFHYYQFGKVCPNAVVTHFRKYFLYICIWMPLEDTFYFFQYTNCFLQKPSLSIPSLP